MNKKAFTLIELLVVVTIIGILAVALVPRIVGGSIAARDRARQVDVQNIAKGMQIYLSDNGTFDDIGNPGNDFCASDLNTYLSEYIGAIPTDPKSDNSATFLFGGGIGGDGGCATAGEYVVTILDDEASGGSLVNYAVGARMEGKYFEEANMYRGQDTERNSNNYPGFLAKLQAVTSTSGRDYFLIY